jgi:hypothetical protein
MFNRRPTKPSGILCDVHHYLSDQLDRRIIEQTTKRDPKQPRVSFHKYPSTKETSPCSPYSMAFSPRARGARQILSAGWLANAPARIASSSWPRSPGSSHLLRSRCSCANRFRPSLICYWGPAPAWSGWGDCCCSIAPWQMGK